MRRAILLVGLLFFATAAIARPGPDSNYNKNVVSGGGGGFSSAFEYSSSANGGFGTSLLFPATGTFNIGSASADRIVVVEALTDFGTLTAPTICGTLGTLDKLDAGNQFGAWHANITTGTTCSVTVHSSGINDAGISVWVIHGQSGGATATPTSNNTLVSSTAEPISFPFTVSAGGVAMVGAYCQNALSNAFTWTNVTGVASFWQSAGGTKPVLASANGTTSATLTGTSSSGACAFGGGYFIFDSWGP
jgi:hypothetical protein